MKIQKDENDFAIKAFRKNGFKNYRISIGDKWIFTPHDSKRIFVTTPKKMRLSWS